MKVALLSSDESKPDFLSELKGKLEKKIADVEVEIFRARKNFDIPKRLAALGNFDVVAVVVLYQKETIELKVLLEKLLDAELEGVEIIKIIEHLQEFDDLSEKELAELKGELLLKVEGLITAEIIK
jgi:hypothetical protein